jgi:hypothetical protein
MTVRGVFGAVHATFAEAERGLEDLVNGADPGTQWHGLKTMVTAGRRVTFVLQKLSSRDPSFEAWYQDLQHEMRTDPLTHYFNKLRTFIEKEGMPQPIYATVQFMNGEEMVGGAQVGIGEDELGLWIHGVMDGWPRPISDEEARAVPAAPVRRFRDIRLPDPPASHLGVPLTETTIDALGCLYLDYLRKHVIAPARKAFLI